MNDEGRHVDEGESGAKHNGEARKQRHYWRLPVEKQGPPWPPMNPERQPNYDALAPRFKVLDEVLIEHYSVHDLAALNSQRTYRRYRLVLTIGAALTGFLAALQAAVGDGAWIGFIVLVTGIITATSTALLRNNGTLNTYLEERAKAEQLRSLYFRYLGGMVEPDSKQGLAAEVANINFPRTA